MPDQPLPLTPPSPHGPPSAADRRHDQPPPVVTSGGGVGWRDRLPELAAGIGTALVAVASAGFVTSGWTSLSDHVQALVLVAGAAGLATTGTWFEGRAGRGLRLVPQLVLLSSVAMLVAGATLGIASIAPGLGRLAMASGGMAGLALAASLLRERRSSVPLLGGAWASAVFAGGPFGRELADRWEPSAFADALTPIAGFLDPAVTSTDHLWTGVGHLLVGLLLVLALPVLHGRARTTARPLALVTFGYAALELNVLEQPVGAVLALGIVIGTLLHGLWSEDVVLVVGGVVASLAVGVRVLAAVFTGKVLATILVLTGGLALLGWAIHAMQRRDADVAREGAPG